MTVCELCKRAGKAQAEAEAAAGSRDIGKAAKPVVKLHRQCLGGTRCDCQHKVVNNEGER